MTEIRIEENFGLLETYFTDALEELEDLEEPLTRAAYFTQEMTLHNMESEGGLTDEGQWIELSPGYAKWKGLGLPILQLTHAMFEDIADPSNVDALGPDEVAYTITDQKAPWHHFGAERSKGGTLPSRPILPAEFFLLEPIEDIVRDWVDDALDANG